MEEGEEGDRSGAGKFVDQKPDGDTITTLVEVCSSL